MARTKYTFEKRQKEIARQKKREEKVARKAEAKKERTDPDGAPLATDAAEDEPQTPENH